MIEGPEHIKNANTNCPVGVRSNRKIRPSQQAARKKQEGKWENK